MCGGVKDNMTWDMFFFVVEKRKIMWRYHKNYGCGGDRYVMGSISFLSVGLVCSVISPKTVYVVGARVPISFFSQKIFEHFCVGGSENYLR